MNPQYQPYEAIDRYLNFQMSEEEAAEFERKLDSDPEFKSIFEAQKVAYTMVVDFEMLKLKNQIQQDLSTSSNVGRVWKWILGLSISTGVIALLFFSLKKENSKNNAVSDSASEIKNTSGVATTTTANDISVTPQKSISGIETNQKGITVDKPQNLIFDKPQNLIFDTPEKYSEQTPANSDPSSVRTSSSNADSVNVSENKDLAKNCAQVSYKGIPFVQESCKDQSDGFIQLDPLNITAGPGPWLYSLSEHEGFKKSKKFQNLDKGNYTVYLKDADQCIRVLVQVSVPEKNCARTKSFSFNTTLQSEWEIPMEMESAQLKIVDRSGKVLLQKNIEKGISDTWSGNSESGAPLSGGLYWLLLSYPDGTQDKLELTIIR